ncbi:MAG: hypothetical protein AXW12_16395 [Thalassospira sp. Nap_22]|nr:MAG: hypothetical protein AXW12_16395 [Thalassospira sp. Nap_22]
MAKWLSDPEQAGLRRAYLEWLRRRLPKWFPGETFPEMHDLQEAYEMTTNRFEEWKERLVSWASSKAELEDLADRVLDATSLDDLFQ